MYESERLVKGARFYAGCKGADGAKERPRRAPTRPDVSGPIKISEERHQRASGGADVKGLDPLISRNLGRAHQHAALLSVSDIPESASDRKQQPSIKTGGVFKKKKGNRDIRNKCPIG